MFCIDRFIVLGYINGSSLPCGSVLMFIKSNVPLFYIFFYTIFYLLLGQINICIQQIFLVWQEPIYMYIPIGKIFRILSFLKS